MVMEAGKIVEVYNMYTNACSQWQFGVRVWVQFFELQTIYLLLLLQIAIVEQALVYMLWTSLHLLVPITIVETTNRDYRI